MFMRVLRGAAGITDIRRRFVCSGAHGSNRPVSLGNRQVGPVVACAVCSTSRFLFSDGCRGNASVLNAAYQGPMPLHQRVMAGRNRAASVQPYSGVSPIPRHPNTPEVP